MPRKKTTLVEEIETKEENSVAEAAEVEAVSEPENKLYGLVNCTLLNIREEPSKNSKIVTLLPLGTKVEITGRVIQGFYPILDTSNPEYKVKGFAMEEFIAVD